MSQNNNTRKSQTINEIVELAKRISQVCSNPNLDRWRQLSVPMAQLKCLFLISNRAAVNSRWLAQELGVTPGNVTGIIDRLAEQELVVRKPDPEDRRIIWLEATPKGIELLSNLMDYHLKYYAMILNFMADDELEALSKALKGLIKAFEQHMDELNTVDKS